MGCRQTPGLEQTPGLAHRGPRVSGSRSWDPNSGTPARPCALARRHLWLQAVAHGDPDADLGSPRAAPTQRSQPLAALPGDCGHLAPDPRFSESPGISLMPRTSWRVQVGGREGGKSRQQRESCAQRGDLGSGGGLTPDLNLGTEGSATPEGCQGGAPCFSSVSPLSISRGKGEPGVNLGLLSQGQVRKDFNSTSSSSFLWKEPKKGGPGGAGAKTPPITTEPHPGVLPAPPPTPEEGPPIRRTPLPQTALQASTSAPMSQVGPSWCLSSALFLGEEDVSRWERVQGTSRCGDL